MMLPRIHDSPIPIKTTSGFDSDTATAPTEALLIWPSVTGSQFSPASVVFQSPPPTAPKYASRGRPFTPLTAMERPPRSGPMLRHCSCDSSEAVAAAGGAGDACCVWTPVENVENVAAARAVENMTYVRIRRIDPPWMRGFYIGRTR